MKYKLMNVSTTVASNPWAVRVVVMAAAMAIALALGLSPSHVVLAGPANGGAGGC